MLNPLYNSLFNAAHLNNKSKRDFFQLSIIQQKLYIAIAVNQNTCDKLLHLNSRLKLVSNFFLKRLRLCGLDFISIYQYLILTHQFFKYRSSRPEVFCEKGVLRNFAKVTGKHLCQSLFFNNVAGAACNFIKKETLAQVFSC